MKVLFINPPSLNELMGNNPEIIESERGYNPPLGILYIAAYVEQYTKHEVRVIDAQVEELSYKKLQKRLEKTDFDIVGITVMTFTLIDVRKTVELIKKTKPEAKIILGGPHASIYPYETHKVFHADFVVIGEGETVFTKILQNLNNINELKKIHGLLFEHENGKVQLNKKLSYITEGELNNLPFPSRHLTPYKKYSSILAKRTPITTLFTSRGCPYSCSFCNRPQMGKNFRALSPERVVKEIENCLELGIHEFLIYDDTFTIKKDRVKKICKLVVEKQLDIGFDIRARVDTIDEEMLILLQKAGCRGIHYGIEAGTEKILKVLKKGINLNKAKEIFLLTKKHNIQTLAYFMIGSPEETREDINETFIYLKKLNPDFIHLTILTPFPATEIYIKGLMDGQIKKDHWKEFALNPNDNFVPPHWDQFFTKDELEELIVKGYKDFYTRPSYIIKSIFKIKSLGELKRKVKAGLKVFLMKKK